MKQALLILFVGIYFQLSCSDYKPNVKPLNDLDRMELKGDVRSLTVAIYKAVEKPEGIIKEEFVSKFNYLFNEYGYMTESVYFKSDSGQDAKTTCKYDEKGKIIEKVTTNNADDLLSKTTLKYDEKGNLIETAYLDNTGDLIYKETLKYDEKGNAIERDGNRSDDSPGEISLYYDEEEGKFKRNHFRPTGNQNTKSTFQYDEKGNQVSERFYISDGGLSSKRINKYDEEGNKIETNVFNSRDTLIFKQTFKYDGKGNLIEEKRGNSDSDMEIAHSYKYDEKGNLMEEIINYGLRISKATYKYNKYDSFGNWLSQTREESSMNTGKVYSKIITERIFEYSK